MASLSALSRRMIVLTALSSLCSTMAGPNGRLSSRCSSVTGISSRAGSLAAPRRAGSRAANARAALGDNRRRRGVGAGHLLRNSDVANLKMIVCNLYSGPYDRII